MFPLNQGCLIALAFRYVLDLGNKVDHPAFVIAYSRHRKMHPHHMSFLVYVAFFKLVVVAASLQYIAHQVGVLHGVLRVGNRIKTKAQQLLFAVPQNF